MASAATIEGPNQRCERNFNFNHASPLRSVIV
jgi:hypothetical protein